MKNNLSINKPIKYALIGCGRISPNHIEAAKNICEALDHVLFYGPP